METKPVYVVWSNTDLIEGRGYKYPLYICEKQSTANRLGKHIYIQGSDCPVTSYDLFKHNNRWYSPVHVQDPSKEDEKVEIQLEAERKRLAAKLQAIEKAKTLGLSDVDIEALKG